MKTTEPNISSKGTFSIITAEGEKVFHIKRAVFNGSKRKGKYFWNFDVETMEELDDAPSIDVCNLPHKINNLDDLLKKPMKLRSGYDEKSERYIATLYHYEHADLNNNVITFLSRQGDSFDVIWTGEGDAMEPVKIKVQAQFHFNGIEIIEEKNCKILLVNKYEFQGESTAEALIDLGYECELASGVDEAEAIFKSTPTLNLLIIYWLNVDENVKIIKALRENGFQGKVIIVSGELAIEDKEVYSVLGIDKIFECADGLDSAELTMAIESFNK